MKRHFRLLMLLLPLFTLVIILSSRGQPPPPPAHGQNGNQASTGGTGCPLDQPQCIMLVLVLSLSYAGFNLYKRVNKVVV